MSHTLIVGTTEAGKSTLGKMLCKTLKDKGCKCAVLDRTNDPGWNTDNVFRKPDDFMVFCKANRSLFLFIDEAGTTLDKYDSEHQWFATQSRHWGHSCYFLTHDAVQLQRVTRDQCSKLYAFTQSRKSAQSLAEEYNDDSLLALPSFPKGQFCVVSRFESSECFRIDFASRRIYKVKPAGDAGKLIHPGG